VRKSGHLELNSSGHCPCDRFRIQHAVVVPRFGPRTPTRARRLADASVDQTDVRNARASSAIGHYFRMASQAVLLAADRFGA
jgi:hypothetical protein